MKTCYSWTMSFWYLLQMLSVLNTFPSLTGSTMTSPILFITTTRKGFQLILNPLYISSEKPIYSQSTSTSLWLVTITLLQIQLILPPQLQHSPTGQNGDLVLQIVVQDLFEAEHDRAILNIVQVQSKRVKRALLQRAQQISTNVLPMIRALNGDQLFYNIEKMEESQQICTIAFRRRVFNWCFFQHFESIDLIGRERLANII